MKHPPIASAVFDAGKTNKKIFVFDQQYNVLDEQTSRFDEIEDEDGFPCEDVHQFGRWIEKGFYKLLASKKYKLAAINFTSYGASFVHIEESGKPALPLYNYLKPFPASIEDRFFGTYGGRETVSRETASPVLGHLNSGLLLYRLKQQNAFQTGNILSLHLPQYLSYLATGRAVSDITSIGCHTMLWNFDLKNYHRWVTEEGIIGRLAPIVPADQVNMVRLINLPFKAGIGLHDSSSALIPYLATVPDPFVLISTGTWSITMNPFNHSPLTASELENDCLCYLTYKGEPVKSSRLFAGHMHEEGVNKLNAHFNKNGNYFSGVRLNETLIRQLQPNLTPFNELDLAGVADYDTAYHMLMLDIMQKQVTSTNFVLNDEVKKIFVDGGFSKNDLYMKLLAMAYPNREVYAASVAQATAMGAALAIHHHWNQQPVPAGLVETKRF